MIPDNQWHPAILYKIGERYRIAKDFEEAEKDPLLSGPVEYQEIKYNWNKGQPIVVTLAPHNKKQSINKTK
jgi:hypothetical protein